MNFLAHLYLARGDDDLMLGALLGDFVKGSRALWSYPLAIREGIRLHRRIDKITDASVQVKLLKKKFPKEFRRYSGIVTDLAFDYELANDWENHSDISLEDFDREVRQTLGRYPEPLPQKLTDFMAYADRRGLFANYRSEKEMLFSLSGMGRRLKRANPLNRVEEIWPEIKQDIHEGFLTLFPEVQSNVAEWRNRRSTSTGS